MSRQRARAALDPGVRLLHAIGVSPNAVTVAGTVLTLLGAAALVVSGPGLAVPLLAAGAIADSLDGRLARVTGRETLFGGFLDSTLDRLSDASWFVAGALVAAREADERGVFVALWALVASFLVPYTRAKAESLGRDAAVGLAPREARILILAVGVVAWAVSTQRIAFTVATALVAVLATVTTAQRVAHVAAQTRTK